MKIWHKIGFLLQLIALLVCFYWSVVAEEEKLFVIRLCTVFLGILLATNVFVYSKKQVEDEKDHSVI